MEQKVEIEPQGPNGKSQGGDGNIENTSSSTITPPVSPSQVPHGFDVVPDGGLRAWLVVAGACVVTIDTFGLANSFGVYQTYYETVLLTSHSSSEIAWIGSLQTAFLTLGGVISGPLYDMGYFHYLTIAGFFLLILGQFLTSLCNAYYQVILAQGIMIGLGNGLLFLPSAVIINQYFAKRRAIAFGIQASGSPIGGIIFPIIFSKLQPTIGFGWATRVIAFILLATAVFPLAVMRTRVPPPTQKRAFIDVSAFTDWPFVGFVAASFFAFLGLYAPFVYIQLYALEHRTSPEDFSAYLITLLNAGSVLGRILPNFFADYLGSLNMLIATTFGASILAYGWLGVNDMAGIIVFAVFYGFFNGGVTSLPPSAIVTLTSDMSRMGTRLGMSFLLTGISVLIGTPVAGAILSYGWAGLIAWSASTMLLGASLYLVAQWLHLKKRKADAASTSET